MASGAMPWEVRRGKLIHDVIVSNRDDALGLSWHGNYAERVGNDPHIVLECSGRGTATERVDRCSGSLARAT